MNVALQIHHRALRAYHYVCVLLLLACMSLSSRAVKGNEDRTLLVLFGVQVWLQVALICVEAVVARGKERDFLLTMLKIMVPPTVPRPSSSPWQHTLPTARRFRACSAASAGRRSPSSSSARAPSLVRWHAPTRRSCRRCSLTRSTFKSGIS